jgi:high-mobility group nucleosome-binding domain-containing protein 2
VADPFRSDSGRAERGAGARRRHRRVSTAPAPGSDPTPQAAGPVQLSSEDAATTWGDRQDDSESRLIQDKPPHY